MNLGQLVGRITSDQLEAHRVVSRRDRVLDETPDAGFVGAAFGSGVRAGKSASAVVPLPINVGTLFHLPS